MTKQWLCNCVCKCGDHVVEFGTVNKNVLTTKDEWKQSVDFSRCPKCEQIYKKRYGLKMESKQ
jgi:hypothetical protein